MKKITIIILFTCIFSFFIACKKEEVITHDLTIFVQDEFYEVKTVNDGSKLDFKLEDDNYIFIGWFDEDYLNQIDGITINEDMNVFAKTVAKGTQYKITYHLTDDAIFKGVRCPRSYVVGETTELVNPVRELAYEFAGWYLNGELITEISDTMYGNLDLYDSWIDNNVYHKITYICNGATSYSAELQTSVMEGKSYTFPYPIKDGYYFKGWYLEETFENRIYEVTTDNKADLTIYAKFEEKSNENTYISFLGDSISTYHGYIPEDAGAYYPTFLNFPAEQTYFLQVVSAMGFNFLKNNSYSGSRLTSVVSDNAGGWIPQGTSDKRIEGLSDGINDPDILIVHIGTNEYSQGVDKYTFQKGIKEFVTKVRAKYDDVDIYFCLHPYNGYGPTYVEPREAYNEVIIEMSKEENCNYKVIDLTTCWGESDYQTYIFSNAHPSVAGFKAMADCIIAKLQETYN